METPNTIPTATNELINLNKRELVKNSQLIRIEEVSAITTLAKSSINLWVAQSKFPKPIALSATVKVWKLQDISNWISSQEQKSQKNHRED